MKTQDALELARRVAAWGDFMTEEEKSSAALAEEASRVRVELAKVRNALRDLRGWDVRGQTIEQTWDNFGKPGDYARLLGETPK